MEKKESTHETLSAGSPFPESGRKKRDREIFIPFIREGSDEKHMYGIVGALSFTGSKFRITEEYLVPMRDTMARRGPDGVGLWIAGDASVGFGHRRLSIIDMSTAASQPMSNSDDTLCVTFNRETYNVCNGHGTTLSDILRMISDHVGIEIERFVGLGLVHPQDNRVIIGSNTKIQSEVGWKPGIPLEKAVQDVVEDWKQRLPDK
jgi:nucleoside-diphosphate-sugar epimerase